MDCEHLFEFDPDRGIYTCINCGKEMDEGEEVVPDEAGEQDQVEHA